MNVPQRFLDKIRVDEFGCHVWTGALSEKGYALFQVNRTTKKAHRWLWTQVRGPLPPGLELDHTCRNRACVNLDHLEPVSHRENVLRGATLAAANAQKTHCPNGHSYTTVVEGGRTRRRCETCARKAKRAYKKRQREARLALATKDAA